MRTASIVIFLAGAVGLAGPASVPSAARPDAQATASRCVPAGASVVARSRDAVVVRRPRTVDSGERVPHHYGCLLSRGRLVRLDENDGGAGAFLDRPVRFAGRYVAYESEFVEMGSASDYTDVVVTDLRSGQTVSRDCTAEEEDGEDIVCFEATVVSLVVKSSGAVAWIDENGAVMKHDRGAAKPRLLDSGRGIERRSLRLRGSRLSWVRGGSRRDATLR